MGIVDGAGELGNGGERRDGAGLCLLPTMNILEGTCSAKTEYCTYEYAPVCGCDKKTYANDCLRKQAKVALYHKGVC